MTLAYRLARTATRDLQEISGFLEAEAGADLATGIVAGVIQTILTISRHPGAGVAASQFGPGVRKFPAGKYVIYYRQYSRGIEILHVFHGARSQMRVWRTKPK